VAGYATRCAQKNFNMLAAIAQAGPHDIYVFADADIGPGKGWLREMVLPFSDGAVTATTAFRWLHRRTVTTRELSHSYMNMFIYTLVSTASFVKSIGLWGGSMALRRTDFDALGVAKRWAETVVDDISLSEIIMKNRRKTVLVPAAVTRTDDFIGSVRASILWFERQAMFLKAYHFISWAWLAPIIYVTWCLMLWLPFALVLSMVTRRGFLSLAGGPALLVYAGQYLTVLLYLFLGPVPGFFRFLLFWPLLRMTHFVSYTRSVLTNVITWSGIRYHLGRGGIVTRVERPPAP